MKYRVQISQLASEQIDEAYLWLAQQTENAWAWHEGLMDAIASLEDNPLRCPHIPEDEPCYEKPAICFMVVSGTHTALSSRSPETL